MKKILTVILFSLSSLVVASELNLDLKKEGSQNIAPTELVSDVFANTNETTIEWTSNKISVEQFPVLNTINGTPDAFIAETTINF